MYGMSAATNPARPTPVHRRRHRGRNRRWQWLRPVRIGTRIPGCRSAPSVRGSLPRRYPAHCCLEHAGAFRASDASARRGWAQAPRDTHRHRAGSSALAPCGARRAAARALPRALPAPSRPMLRLLSTPAWERPSSSAHLQPAWATDRRLLWVISPVSSVKAPLTLAVGVGKFVGGEDTLGRKGY